MVFFNECSACKGTKLEVSLHGARSTSTNICQKLVLELFEITGCETFTIFEARVQLCEVRSHRCAPTSGTSSGKTETRTHSLSTPPPPAPACAALYCCVYDVDASRYLKSVGLYSVCLFGIGSFHAAKCPQGPPLRSLPETQAPAASVYPPLCE